MRTGKWGCIGIPQRGLGRTERRARGLRAAVAGYEAAIEGPPRRQQEVSESRRWLRSNGKPIRPIRGPWRRYFRCIKANWPPKSSWSHGVRRAFKDKNSAESRFKTSIQTNVRLNKLIQTDANGKALTWIQIQALKSPSSIFPGITGMIVPRKAG
jgi:hypothetical protein